MRVKVMLFGTASFSAKERSTCAAKSSGSPVHSGFPAKPRRNSHLVRGGGMGPPAGKKTGCLESAESCTFNAPTANLYWWNRKSTTGA